MNRRNFLGTLIACFSSPLIPKPIELPGALASLPAQQIFYGGACGGGKTIRIMYGIPYHHTNASTGTWLGLERKTK